MDGKGLGTYETVTIDKEYAETLGGEFTEISEILSSDLTLNDTDIESTVSLNGKINIMMETVNTNRKEYNSNIAIDKKKWDMWISSMFQLDSDIIKCENSLEKSTNLLT